MGDHPDASMRGLDHRGTRYVSLDDLLLLVERYRQAWDGHGDGDAAVVLAAVADALAEWSITMPQNAQVAAPDDHETPRGRDGADTGCTDVPDVDREPSSAASITNVLGHRDAEGSHLVALAERDAALARVEVLGRFLDEARSVVERARVSASHHGHDALVSRYEDFLRRSLDA